MTALPDLDADEFIKRVSRKYGQQAAATVRDKLNRYNTLSVLTNPSSLSVEERRAIQGAIYASLLEEIKQLYRP